MCSHKNNPQRRNILRPSNGRRTRSRGRAAECSPICRRCRHWWARRGARPACRCFFLFGAFAPLPGGSLDGGLFELLESRPSSARSFASSASSSSSTTRASFSCSSAMRSSRAASSASRVASAALSSSSSATDSTPSRDHRRIPLSTPDPQGVDLIQVSRGLNSYEAKTGRAPPDGERALPTRSGLLLPPRFQEQPSPGTTSAPPPYR